MTGKKVKQILRKNGYVLAEVAKSMGIIPQTLHSLLDVDDIKTGVLERIAAAIKESVYFFYQQDAVMPSATELNTMAQQYCNTFMEVTQKLGKRGSQPIPVYDLQTVDENLAMIFDNQPAPVEYISLPNLPNIDGAVYMRGDSMYPEIKGGDIVLYKKINGLRNSGNIFFGQMYLLSFSINDDQHIVVKYLHQSQDERNVTLVSTNKNYPPMEIPIETISALAIIKASVRYNTIV